MICIPCNLEFRDFSVKVCPYCDHKLTERGRPEPKEAIRFPDEGDKGFNGVVGRPIERCKHDDLRPKIARDHVEKPSKRRLRLRTKRSQDVVESRDCYEITAEGMKVRTKLVAKSGKIRVTSK